MKRIKPSGRGNRLRLTLLLATAAAFLLVPVASAFAGAESPAEYTLAGSGSGSVEGDEGISNGHFQGGEPLVECHWNGVAIDVGTPGPGECKSSAQELVHEAPYAAITVYANPDPGSAFGGWTLESGYSFSGGCSEEGSPLEPECTALTFGEPGEEIKAKAVFNKAFTVEKEGEGTVVGAESGLNCTPSEAYCGVEYEGPETLTASPAAGYAFSKWKGCTKVPTEVLSCTVTATSATKVIAYFVPTKTFTVEKAGSGYGKVTSTGISCDESCSTATAAIQAGKLVKVKAIPAKGSKAAVVESETGSAIGNCPGGEAACEFTIEANSSVKVKFEPKPTKVVTLNLTGPGAYKGKVTGKSTLIKGLVKSGLSCGTGCTTTKEAFFEGDEVELTATASTGYSFDGWTISGGSAGTCTAKVTPCKAPIDAVKTISAEFE